MKHLETSAEVYAPVTDEGDGALLGHYPVVISYRSAEEVESGDVQYTNVQYTVLGDVNRAPSGGFRRGMVIEPEGGGRYHVLTAVTAGRIWIMKALRAVTNGGETEDE